MADSSKLSAVLLQLLNEGYNRPAWHGPNLRGSLRLVTPRTATWLPPGGRYNIAQIALHAAYWKYATRRRLCGDERGSFGLKGSNWFTVPLELGAVQWREYLAMLDGEHAKLIEAVAGMTDGGLAVTPAGSKVSHQRMVMGVAMHDVYHAGQIQIIKRQWKHAAR